ncbi:MAG: SusC/RagA family TonB-linked outer membrane protein [Bacteroidota bacterium]|nr:SusC/RagA family TonB-linked outer membrane protein [Bacteroidota bacterium]MDP4272990.1 SusC/RagA family TonB-linked outer membrane protein [Bacteroidota bacterium]
MKLLRQNCLPLKSRKRVFVIIAMAIFTIASISAQQIKVSGRVNDESGQPIPGVSVRIEGSNVGTVTDLNGNYSLSPQVNQVLEFSFIGMKTQKIVVKSKNLINVVLQAEAVKMEEVVVTALGIKRSEKALGYSVQKVSGESLQKVSGVDVATSLTGKVAGLLVKNSPDFAVAPTLTIRGENPLLVIDGVPYANKTISDMSSEDIVSMSVLKGATASALYGFRGANGAILITTKNGSTNKTAGLTADFATNTMFTAGFLAIPKVQSVYGRGNNNTYDKNATSVWGGKMDGSIQNQWDPFLKEYRDYAYLPVGKNNFKNFLEQGYVTNNNFNISYKGDVASLRSSINWTQNKGQYPNAVLDKYTYTFGGDINLKKFKLSSDLSYSKKTSPNMGSNGYTSYDPMYSLLIWSATDYNILDYKDNYWLDKGKTQNFCYKSTINNPYFDAYERTNEIARDVFNADVSTSYEITNWLKASIRSGLDFYIDRGDQRVSWGSYTSTGNTPIPGNLWTWNGAYTGGYNTGRTSGYSMNNDLLLTGEKSINKLNVEYLAGGTMYFKRDDNIYAMTQGGISVPDFFSIAASVNPPLISASMTRQQVNSLYGRLSLSWDRMVYLEATGRNDWSSTLPSTTRSYFYPSLASSFVISELLPGTKNWLDLLKVRSSWTMSKTPPAIYAVNSTFSLASSAWGSGYNAAYSPTSLYSPTLLPASANTFEAGLEGIVFKNRLMVDVSYYNKLMYNALISGPLSAATGYTGNYVNSKEEISRRGWEVTVNGSPIKNNDWQWDLGLNWSTFARYYTKLDPTYSTVAPWIKVGARVDAFVSKDFVRDPSGNLVFNNGRLQYSQYNSNFGWSDPDWLWGANSTLRYKNVSLFVSLDGVVGGLMNTRTESYMWQSGVHPGSVTEARAKDVATPGSKNFVGQGVKVISGTVTYDNFGNITKDTRVFAPNDVATTYKQYIVDLHNSSAWGGNGSPVDTYSKTFFKLREISLTYDVPNKFLHGIAKAASVSFVGQNVLLWAKDFKYSDPDGGTEDFSDPAVRYLGCNIKLTF